MSSPHWFCDSMELSLDALLGASAGGNNAQKVPHIIARQSELPQVAAPPAGHRPDSEAGSDTRGGAGAGAGASAGAGVGSGGERSSPRAFPPASPAAKSPRSSTPTARHKVMADAVKAAVDATTRRYQVVSLMNDVVDLWVRTSHEARAEAMYHKERTLTLSPLHLGGDVNYSFVVRRWKGAASRARAKLRNTSPTRGDGGRGHQPAKSPMKRGPKDRKALLLHPKDVMRNLPKHHHPATPRRSILAGEADMLANIWSADEEADDVAAEPGSDQDSKPDTALERPSHAPVPTFGVSAFTFDDVASVDTAPVPTPHFALPAALSGASSRREPSSRRAPYSTDHGSPIRGDHTAVDTPRTAVDDVGSVGGEKETELRREQGDAMREAQLSHHMVHVHRRETKNEEARSKLLQGDGPTWSDTLGNTHTRRRHSLGVEPAAEQVLADVMNQQRHEREAARLQRRTSGREFRATASVLVDPDVVHAVESLEVRDVCWLR